MTRALEWTTVRIENDWRKDKENTGKNLRMNDDTWEYLDTSEQKDPEPIRGYLHKTPVRF